MGASLREGQYVSSSRSVLNLIDHDAHWILTAVKQNALVRIAEGQPVSVLLASSPGEIYTSTVAQVPREAVGGQVTAEDTSNPFAAISEANGLYPVRLHFPANADTDLRRAGTVADVTFFTDDGNPINTLAKILLWISTWMAYIF